MNSIIDKLLLIPGILLALSVHEFAHAYSAVKLGDNTPKLQGRLTLNPIKHIDPLGFLCLIFFGFGWANPVVVDPRNFKNYRRDDTIVSSAGCIANFFTAVIFAAVLKLFTIVPSLKLLINNYEYIYIIIMYTIQINIVLMVFNLIPIPPLDGHHIIANIIGEPAWNFFNKYGNILRLIMLIVIITGYTGIIISPIISYILNFIINIFF